MRNEIRFQEMLADLCRLAKVNQNKLQKRLVNEFFQEMELSEDQMNLVYEYFKEQKIQIVSETIDSAAETEELSDGVSEQDMSGEDILMYDISHSDKRGEDREDGQTAEEGASEWKARMEELCSEILAGNQEKKQSVLALYQPEIAEYVKRYRKSGIPEEDLIQDGTLGVLLALEALGVKPETMTFTEYLEAGMEEEIRRALEEEYQAEKADEQLEKQVNEFHKKVMALTDELERKPSLEEVCLYMKLPRGEVEYYFRLMGKTIEE